MVYQRPTSTVPLSVHASAGAWCASGVRSCTVLYWVCYGVKGPRAPVSARSWRVCLHLCMRAGHEHSATHRLLLLTSECLCQGLAAAWREDPSSPLVHAMLLPPEPTLAPPSEVKVRCISHFLSLTQAARNEYLLRVTSPLGCESCLLQVMALITGRMYVLLNAEPQLSHLVLPLLADSLAASSTAAYAPSITPAAPGVATVVDRSLGTASASAAAVASVRLRPDVFACLAVTLAGMAAWAACKHADTQSQSWTFQQVKPSALLSAALAYQAMVCFVC